MGFGVPVMVKDNRTYLSYTALTEQMVDNSGMRKTFFLDALQQLNFGNRAINSQLAYTGIELSGHIYKKSRFAQRFLRQWGRVRSKAGFEYGFTKIEPQGKIAVDYHIFSNSVAISVDLSDFHRTASKANMFLLNEGGANHFPHYADAGGHKLERHEIGPWQEIEAQRAWFKGEQNPARFCVQQQPGTTLFRGWELSHSLSWAGFIFDVSQFRKSVFTYPIMFV